MENSNSNTENKEELKLKILSAEDNAGLRESLTMLIKSWGHEVEAVENGQLLLDKLATGEKFDLVITDNNMPVMGGVEALGKIRELYGNLPVIVFTGGATNKEIEIIQKKFGAIYLDKLSEIETLKNAIKKAIENA